MNKLKSINDIKALVEEYREAAVELLQKAVQTPSSTGEETEMGKLFAKEMENFGMDVQKIEYEEGRTNLIAEWVGNEEGKKFLFNGHMDVFPPNAGIEGKFGPWSGRLEGGNLYGRGSVDMKSGDCAAMMAVRILKEQGYVPDGKIVLSYMVDEERSSEMGVISLLDNGYLTDADCGVCMEPTHCGALIAQGGIWQANISYYSEGGHAIKEIAAEDALKKSIRAIRALNKLKEQVEQRTHPVLGKQFFKINTMHAGQMSNTIPTMSTFGFDRRFSPDDCIEDVKKEILDVLDGLKAENPDYAYDIEDICYYPSFKMNLEDENVQAMIRASDDVLGKPTTRMGWMGGTDSAFIMNRTPAQILVYGPGDGALTGTVDEYVSIEEYLTVIAIYIHMIDMVVGEKTA